MPLAIGLEGDSSFRRGGDGDGVSDAKGEGGGGKGDAGAGRSCRNSDGGDRGGLSQVVAITCLGGSDGATAGGSGSEIGSRDRAGAIDSGKRKRSTS